MGWVIRDGVGPPQFEYGPDTAAFTIKLLWGPNYESMGYIDFCEPDEMSYTAIINMAATLGCLDVKKIFYKRLDSDFDTDALELRLDKDAKELGCFATSDMYKQVAVFCQTIVEYSDSSENEEQLKNVEVESESEDLEKFSGSDAEIGKEDETLVDVQIGAEPGLGADMSKVHCEPINDVDIEKTLNEGYCSEKLESIDGSDEDEANYVVKYPRFNQVDIPNVKFTLGMLFATGDEFREVLREYSIRNFKDVKYKRNCREKMTLVCYDKKCPWYLHVAKLPDQETVQIRVFTDKHTCSRSRTNRHVKPRYIAKRFLEMIRINPTWPTKNFAQYVSLKLEYTVDEYKAYRAFRIALKAIQGSSADQYNMLYDYAAEIKRTNPGTTVEIKLLEGRFHGIYICWAALKRGFIEGCRPVVGLDGCHLTGPHKGVLLTAVAIDANDCMYPFAYGVVDVENYKNWKWFIKLIRADLNIQRDEDYTFISDKQKGLIKAMEKLMPLVEHRFCVRHLYNNFKQDYKGLVLKDILWNAARAPTMKYFNDALEEMKKLNVEAYEWLVSKPAEQWSRSHFKEYPKCDILLNNLCESFNAAIKIPRGKPILTMLEDIRVYLMSLVMRKKECMRRNEFFFCPKIHKKMEKLKGEYHGWIIEWNGDDKFECKGPFGQRYETDIGRRRCGCNRWQLSGLPCVHGVGCIMKMGEEIEPYVHECYTKATYMKTYTCFLNPLNGPHLWPKTNSASMLPPFVSSVRKGRPPKIRRKAPDEQEDGKKKVSKKGTIIKCKTCGKSGHNQRTCGKEPRPKKKYSKKKKETTEEPESSEIRPTKKPKNGGPNAEVVQNEVVEENEIDGDNGGVQGDNEEHDKEDDDFWNTVIAEHEEELNCDTQCVQNIQTNQKKLPIAKRKSQKIMERAPKGPVTKTYVDLTEEENAESAEIPTQESVITSTNSKTAADKGKALLHGGIMRPFQAPRKQPKGILLKDGRLQVNALGMKAALGMLKKKKD